MHVKNKENVDFQNINPIKKALSDITLRKSYTKHTHRDIYINIYTRGYINGLPGHGIFS